MQFVLDKTASITVNIVHQAFTWMCVGLLVTTMTALYVTGNQALSEAIFSHSILFFGLMIAEVGLVFFLGLRITHLSFGAAVLSFAAYSLLNGLTLSVIFLMYTATSIVSTFLTSALVFGVMAFYGYTTKKDLTTIGNLAIMGLIGVILASMVNIFLKSDAFSYVLSYLSIVLFIGLTAYDTQKIKAMALQTNNENMGIFGALLLYLDFINIFLNLLRIMGKRRN